jgi:hypothetical protein
MHDKFSISVDRRLGIVRIAMNGFFTHDDLAAFVVARREAHEALGWPRNTHVTLNDVRGMKIQAQDIVDAFQHILADPDFRSRRLAFVCGPTLARLQLERALAGRPDTLCFADPADAETWLFEEERPAPRRAACGSR